MSGNTNIALKLLQCIDFAAKKHANQRRKDAAGTPYINHPIGVANILISEGNIDDEEVLLAAILHDTVEDTDTTFEEIEKHFGANVKKIVSEVTDDKTLPKLERKRLQIANAGKCSNKAKLVKLADKLYNLRDLRSNPPRDWSEERCKEYFIWAEMVVDNIRGTNAALEEQLDIIFAEQKQKI